MLAKATKAMALRPFPGMEARRWISLATGGELAAT